MECANWPWSELDIAPTVERAGIKRAYAAKLKTLDRERDIAAFQRLRQAYEHAMSSAASDPVGTTNEAPSETATVDAAETRDLPSIEWPASVATEQIVRPDPARIAEGIFIELLGAKSAAEATQVLLEFPVLEDYGFASRISVELAQKLVVADELPWTVLRVLVHRFHWDDVYGVQALPSDVRLKMAALLRRRNEEAGVVDSDVRRRVDDLMRYLRPPFGFLRSMQIGFRLDFLLEREFAAFTQRFGREWSTVLHPESLAFVESFAGRRFRWSIFLGQALGRAAAIGLCFGVATFVGSEVEKISRPLQKTALVSGLAFVAVIVLHLIRELRRWLGASKHSRLCELLDFLLLMLGMATVVTLASLLPDYFA